MRFVRGKNMTPWLLTLLLIVNGCASSPKQDKEGPANTGDPEDPFESVNRATYQFNDTIDSYALKPVAKGYRAVTPDPAEEGISNFFSNLGTPVVLVNNALQGKFGRALSDGGRFLVNSTLGLLGFFDPAREMGLEEYNEDLGQTFGVWGAPRGPYLVLPFLGPSTVRDGLGSLGDAQLDPLIQLEDTNARVTLIFADVVNTRAELLQADRFVQESFDPYYMVRDAYLQRRRYLLHDGSPPAPDFPEDDFEDPADWEDE